MSLKEFGINTQKNPMADVQSASVVDVGKREFKKYRMVRN